MQNQPCLTEYELQRAARIAANKQRMEELGVLQAAQHLNELNRPQNTMRWRKPSVAKPRPPPGELVATRASKRIRGEPVAASAGQEDTSSGQGTDSNNTDAVTTSSAQASSGKGNKDPNAPRFELTDTQYAAPFLLTSIGVTVLELGQVYRGPFSSNYWSSRGCLFRHAYPVGYRASKEVFGHTWDMEISAGEGGPVFKVSQRGGARSFSGPTPTRPLTDACLAFRPGQRISGPLFFGFSDVLVQRALAAMYNPSELSYALYGTPLGAPLPAASTQPQLRQQQQDQALLEAQQQHSDRVIEPQQQQQGAHQQQSDTAGAAAADPGLAVAMCAPGSTACEDSSSQLEPAFELTDTKYGVPFTLSASGVTVWELGQVYRGPFSSNYWSSKGLYRHAYPIGYRASKEVFGHTWDMKISAGEKGPIFTVSQKGGGRSFSGPSPTRPWTDICQVFRNTQRISGPLYFGFSDLHVQRALAALYNPSELSLALYGLGVIALLPALQSQQGQVPSGQQQSDTLTKPQQHQQQLPTPWLQPLPQQPAQGDMAAETQPSSNSRSSCDTNKCTDGTTAAASIGHEDLGPQQGEAQQAYLQQQQGQQPAVVEHQPQQQQQQQEQAGQELAAAEAFAAELQCIRGIGAATAQVMALTTALGGSRHGSMRSLLVWLVADPQHPAQLMHYLLHSEEVPRCSRQLPAWRETWVPGILQQLQAMQQQQQQH